VYDDHDLCVVFVAHTYTHTQQIHIQYIAYTHSHIRVTLPFKMLLDGPSGVLVFYLKLWPIVKRKCGVPMKITKENG